MSLLELFISFFKIGSFSFGGGYAMLPLFKKEILEVYQGITVEEFINILGVMQMTPGPVGLNTSIFLGYRINSVLGSLVAMTGLLMPPIFIVLTLSYFFNKYKDSKYITWAFKGIRPVVLGLISSAALFVGKDTFVDVKSVIIALGVFYLIAIKKLHPILGIVGAGFVGALIY